MSYNSGDNSWDIGDKVDSCLDKVVGWDRDKAAASDTVLVGFARIQVAGLPLIFKIPNVDILTGYAYFCSPYDSAFSNFFSCSVTFEDL